MKKDLFMFDIETAANYPNYETFLIEDERGAKLFENKFNKMRWSETYDSVGSAYLDNAGIMSTYGRIVCISVGFLEGTNKRIKSFYGKDEREIVNSFNDLLEKIEKKNFNLCGFRIINFDIPWVLHKLHKYGIKPANIIYTYDKKPWEMRITDISADWKGRFAWSYSFDEVAYQLGIESPKDIICGSDVNKLYWEGKLEDIKEYCEKDVMSSIDVANKVYFT